MSKAKAALGDVTNTAGAGEKSPFTLLPHHAAFASVASVFTAPTPLCAARLRCVMCVYVLIV